jgi:hypothetical protein
MFEELIIMSGVVLTGCLLVWGLLYLKFKRHLVTTLWSRLIPGIFFLCITLYILGHFSVYNISAVVICFMMGSSVMLDEMQIV